MAVLSGSLATAGVTLLAQILNARACCDHSATSPINNATLTTKGSANLLADIPIFFTHVPFFMYYSYCS